MLKLKEVLDLILVISPILEMKLDQPGQAICKVHINKQVGELGLVRRILEGSGRSLILLETFFSFFYLIPFILPLYLSFKFLGISLRISNCNPHLACLLLGFLYLLVWNTIFLLNVNVKVLIEYFVWYYMHS